MLYLSYGNNLINLEYCQQIEVDGRSDKDWWIGLQKKNGEWFRIPCNSELQAGIRLATIVRALETGTTKIIEM